MKRILCAILALILVLSACSIPGAAQKNHASHGIYQFTFDVERLSGWSLARWDFTYTYNGERIQSGHRIRFPLDLFTFDFLQVKVIEKGTVPWNSYSVKFPVGICDGGSGKTEITVTDSNGRTATFKIVCKITQVGKL